MMQPLEIEHVESVVAAEYGQPDPSEPAPDYSNMTDAQKIDALLGVAEETLRRARATMDAVEQIGTMQQEVNDKIAELGEFLSHLPEMASNIPGPMGAFIGKLMGGMMPRG